MSISNVTSPLNRRPLCHNPTVRPKLLLFVLALGLVSVALAQPFPSFLLDTGFVIGTDRAGASNAVSAITDSTGLVVWNSDGHVKGCLTTAGRTTSSKASIDISGPNEVFGASPLDVGKSPSGYLVVWRGDQGGTLRGAVVSPSGEVVLRETLVCYTIGYPLANPAVAFDGTNYLVAWEEAGPSATWVLYTRVSQAGAVLDWPPLKVCPAGGGQCNVSLSFGDSCYLAAYWYWVPGKGDSGIWCSRILPNGAVLDSAGIPVRHWQKSLTLSRGGNTSVTFDGQRFVVSWFERSAPFDVRAARVTPAGVVLDTEGLVIGTSPLAPTGVLAASVNDTSLLVWQKLWADTSAIAARRLSGQGQLLDSSDILVTPPVYTQGGWDHPRVCAASRCGDDFLVTSTDYIRSPGWDYDTREVQSRRVSAAGQVLDTFGTPLSYAANYQTGADAASDGEDYLAVWTDLRTGLSPCDCAVYGMRFSNEGRALDPSSLRIGLSGSHSPRVAYGAGCYLVSWLMDFGIDSSQAWAARVRSDGVLLDTSPIRIPGTVYDCVSGDPDVAYGDSLFLVVWWPGGCAEGARVGADGVLLDSTPIKLETSHGRVGHYPRVASDGQDFLVVWVNGDMQRVCGLRVGSSGEVLDTAIIVIDRYSAPTETPTVAFGAGVYLVVEPWLANRAWRVTPDGIVLDTIHFDPGLHFPEVTYDGTSFFLVEGFRTSEGLTHGYRAIRISPQGEVLDSTKLDIIDLWPENTYAPEDAFGLTADLQGHVGMAFPTYETNPYVSQRIRVSAFPAVVGGICDRAPLEQRAVNRASVIRSALPLVVSRNADLLDISGRRAANLRLGANDIRRLTPGVYFVREEPQGASSMPQAVRKVVIAK